MLIPSLKTIQPVLDAKETFRHYGCFNGGMNVFTESAPAFSTGQSGLATHRTNQSIPRAISVWLVDDDEAVRGLIASLLDGKAGIECSRQFSSAEAILEALAREPAPDVVLLDVNMGGQSGIDALPLIRTLAPMTRVLILTTFFDSRAKSKAFAAGAAGFLLKRDSVERLVASIQGMNARPERDARFAMSARLE